MTLVKSGKGKIMEFIATHTAIRRTHKEPIPVLVTWQDP